MNLPRDPVKPPPESPLSGCRSCRWGSVATARHAECRDCVPPEWKSWEAKKDIEEQKT
jgi:hypothetical protein